MNREWQASGRQLLAVGVVATAVLSLFLPPGPQRQIPAFALLWLWPAATWQRLIPGSTAERCLTAAALSLAANPLLALLIHYLPGPFPMTLMLAAATAFALAPLLTQPLLPTSQTSAFSTHHLLLLALLLIILAVRFTHLGYKELQGDEGIILSRAAAALTGDDAELFLHQKGPLEILIPMAGWSLTGAATDFWLRLPFAWAAMLAVAAVGLLTARSFGRTAGLLAALLFAIMGFSIAFGRIIQYQSLVLLFTTTALLSAFIPQPPSPILPPFLLAAALLAHYDAVLFFPAVAVALFSAQKPFRWRPWLLALLIGTAVLATFYLPFALNPNFGRTLSYLLNDRVGADGGSLAGGRLSDVWRMLTFYNSTYYIVGLTLLAAVGLWQAAGGKFQAPSIHYSLLALLLVPLLFYTLIVTDPRTHIYTFMPGVVIFAAVGVVWLGSGRWRSLAIGLFLIWYGVSAAYPALLFLDVAAERQRNWAEARPRGYWTSWDEPPQFGLFGFPYQAGWRAILPLLEGRTPYASNEEQEITDIYTAQAPRTHCPNFQTFIRAANVQDEIPFDAALLDSLHPVATVTVNGRETIHLYSRNPIPNPPTIEATAVQRWLTPAQVAPPTTGSQYPLSLTLGTGVRLLGYDLDMTNAHPGGQLIVILYWQPLAPFSRNYQTFIHLGEAAAFGQHDGAPECDHNPTTRWEAGQLIPDPHIVPIAADAPANQPIPLYAGMYDLLTLERLPVPNTPSGLIRLRTVELTP